MQSAWTVKDSSAQDENAPEKGVETMVERCGWAQSERMIDYHDREWGVPVRDDRKLFEFLLLEGAQAGLSWETILRKREGYRDAFAGFDPEAVARFDDAKIQRLLAHPGIVRNRQKIASAVKNARAFLRVREEHGTFADYIWSFVGGAQQVNRWRTLDEVPAETEASRRMSKELKKQGFSFVGPTICYSFMQAVGLVNDHLVTCFRHPDSAGRG